MLLNALLLARRIVHFVDGLVESDAEKPEAICS